MFPELMNDESLKAWKKFKKEISKMSPDHKKMIKSFGKEGRDLFLTGYYLGREDLKEKQLKEQSYN